MKDAPVRHRLEYAAFLGVEGLIRLLGPSGARSLGRGLGTLAHALLGSRRKLALANLRRAFPDLGAEELRRLARASFQNFALALCDTLASARYDRVEFCRRMSLEGLENLIAAEKAGKGVFVLSAHLGCWEAAAQAVAQARGPLYAVGRPLDNPHLYRRLRALRTRFGNGVLEKRGAARAMLKHLKNGDRVGILIDQHPRDGEGTPVPFFGHPARTSDVLARLSLSSGAPVVTIAGIPEPRGRYRIVFGKPLWPEEVVGNLEDADTEARVAALTLHYNRLMEEQVRRWPELWLWIHDRWKA